MNKNDNLHPGNGSPGVAGTSAPVPPEPPLRLCLFCFERLPASQFVGWYTSGSRVKYARKCRECGGRAPEHVAPGLIVGSQFKKPKVLAQNPNPQPSKPVDPDAALLDALLDAVGQAAITKGLAIRGLVPWPAHYRWKAVVQTRRADLLQKLKEVTP